MKSVFSICKIFSFCFLVVYLFSSCKPTLTVNDTEVPKKVIITITGYDVSTEKLTMVDEAGQPADIIQAWPGQKIKWKIKGSGIKSIESMPEKKAPYIKKDVFSEEPHEEVFGKTWKATIKKEFPFTKDTIINYDYNIEWKLENDPKSYNYDPRIQMHTK